jgi:hypothetical protein
VFMNVYRLFCLVIALLCYFNSSVLSVLRIAISFIFTGYILSKYLQRSSPSSETK